MFIMKMHLDSYFIILYGTVAVLLSALSILMSGNIWQLVMMSIFSDTAFRSSRINLMLWEALMMAPCEVLSWAVALRTLKKKQSGSNYCCHKTRRVKLNLIQGPAQFGLKWAEPVKPLHNNLQIIYNNKYAISLL